MSNANAGPPARVPLRRTQTKRKGRSRHGRLRPNERPLSRGEGEGKDSGRYREQFPTAHFVPFATGNPDDHALAILNSGTVAKPLRCCGDDNASRGLTAVFKTNFLLGLLVGAAIAVAIPLAGAEVFATMSGLAQAAPQAVPKQIVNRAGKADRLHPQSAIRGSAPKAQKILEGCDPAFSPLSTGAAASNFSSRCLV